MPNALTATEAARKIRDGQLSSVELVTGCLKRIEETDDQLHAWISIDQEAALKRAGELDHIRQRGKPLGALHGIPVGLKDIIDTATLPTQRGTPIYDGRQAGADAAIAERLLDAGAVVLGKTATAELAFVQGPETRNPHDVNRTPGGSSSGSAASVAAFQVPLSVGTQTNGSVIRPASYCGTYGFKPTSGVISRRGIMTTSKTLDQVGVLGRSLDDVALLANVLSGYDGADPASYPLPRPDMVAGANSEAPVEPNFAWMELPYADRYSADVAVMMNEVADALSGQVERIPAHDSFAPAIKAHNTIHEYEICQHLKVEFDQHWDKISERLQAVITEARKISKSQYEDALSLREKAIVYFDSFFKDYDAILTPSALSTAPDFSEGTGDPVCSTVWTLCGLPCLSMPLATDAANLPMGVQLVGGREEDDRLMRTAKWLLTALQ